MNFETDYIEAVYRVWDSEGAGLEVRSGESLKSVEIIAIDDYSKDAYNHAHIDMSLQFAKLVAQAINKVVDDIEEKRRKELPSMPL